MPDLARSTERSDSDPSRSVDIWAKSLFPQGGTVETLALLTKMNETIHADFSYNPREAEGVQSPSETLATKSGTCRDFAVLMLAAARALGFAGRFVSGYLGIEGTEKVRSVGNATHAWVELYLPGAGWIDFDPTNNIIGGRNLIRVAWARLPGQAIPISGSWTGAPADYLGMSVDVSLELATPETSAKAA
jgi:transglutaminase-like putative cysteine protease